MHPEEHLEFLFGAESKRFYEQWKQNYLIKYLRSCQSKEIILLKTHVAPIDDNPAIVVVRDGRDAITAVTHFWKGMSIRDTTIGQISLGFAGWSNFYYSWQNRAKTILVKFEDMIKGPDEMARKIADFLNMPVLDKFYDDFEICKQQWPVFFNDRIGCWKDEMTKEDLDLFWKCHGPMMKELGYE
jgi:hypothetical protein